MNKRVDPKIATGALLAVIAIAIGFLFFRSRSVPRTEADTTMSRRSGEMMQRMMQGGRVDPNEFRSGGAAPAPPSGP